jgi:DNA-binding LytR/AlgR family response regulator
MHQTTLTNGFSYKGSNHINVVKPASDTHIIDALQVCIVSANDDVSSDLRTHLSKLKAVQVCRVYNDVESLLYIQNENAVLVFIDAVLCTKATAGNIKLVLPSALIILLTNQSQLLDKDVHEYIFHQINAPFLFGELFSIISQVVLYRKSLLADNVQMQKSFVLIKSEYRLIKIKLADILFIAGMKDYIKIWIKDRPVPLTTLQNLKEFEKKLPGQDFIRVHKSYIVALQHIDCIARNEIMIGTYSIPVGDAFRNGLNGFIEAHS